MTQALRVHNVLAIKDKTCRLKPKKVGGFLLTFFINCAFNS